MRTLISSARNGIAISVSSSRVAGHSMQMMAHVGKGILYGLQAVAERINQLV